MAATQEEGKGRDTACAENRRWRGRHWFAAYRGTVGEETAELSVMKKTSQNICARLEIGRPMDYAAQKLEKFQPCLLVPPGAPPSEIVDIGSQLVFGKFFSGLSLLASVEGEIEILDF